MIADQIPALSRIVAVVGVPTGPQFEEDSERLRSLLHGITTSLDNGSFSSGHPRQVLDLLQELSHQIAVHFALEETTGLLADPDLAAHELADLAAELRAEHRTLANEVESVVEQAETMVSCVAASEPERRRVVSRIRVFCHKLREHERRENELLMQAYDEDLGVGD